MEISHKYIKEINTLHNISYSSLYVLMRLSTLSKSYIATVLLIHILIDQY